MSTPAEMTVTAPKDTVQSNTSRKKHPILKKPAENSLQKMQIEAFRLTFLINCKDMKRPPPTLRANGFSALGEVERIQLLSDMETVALNKAITRKKKDIKFLKRTSQQSEKPLQPLSRKQKKMWKKHFGKIIAFYKSKESTNWKLWPKKCKSENSKQKNIKSKRRRNFRRKKRQIESPALYQNNCQLDQILKSFKKTVISPASTQNKHNGYKKLNKHNDYLKLEKEYCWYHMQFKKKSF